MITAARAESFPQSPPVLLMNKVTSFGTGFCSSQQSLTKLSTVHALRVECAVGGPLSGLILGLQGEPPKNGSVRYYEAGDFQDFSGPKSSNSVSGEYR